MDMSEFISKNEVKSYINSMAIPSWYARKAKEWIDEAETIEITLCRECPKWRILSDAASEGYCNKYHTWTASNGFCSFFDE